MARDHISFIELPIRNLIIARSKIFIENGKESIKLYYERINSNNIDFDKFTFTYPSEKFSDVEGYNKQELFNLLPELRTFAQIAIEDDKEMENAQNIQL